MSGKRAANERQTMRECPLCGSGDIRLYSVAYHSSGKQSVIKCRGCGCEVRAHSGRHDEGVEGMPDKESTMLMLAKGRVREKWNRRHERTCHAVYEVVPYKNSPHLAERRLVCSSCGRALRMHNTYRYCPGCGARVVGE